MIVWDPLTCCGPVIGVRERLAESQLGIPIRTDRRWHLDRGHATVFVDVHGLCRRSGARRPDDQTPSMSSGMGMRERSVERASMGTDPDG